MKLGTMVQSGFLHVLFFSRGYKGRENNYKAMKQSQRGGFKRTKFKTNNFSHRVFPFHFPLLSLLWKICFSAGTIFPPKAAQEGAAFNLYNPVNHTGSYYEMNVKTIMDSKRSFSHGPKSDIPWNHPSGATIHKIKAKVIVSKRIGSKNQAG